MPERKTEKTSFYLQHPVQIGDQDFKKGETIAVIETPRGVSVAQAINAILKSMATPNAVVAPAEPSAKVEPEENRGKGR